MQYVNGDVWAEEHVAVPGPELRRHPAVRVGERNRAGTA